MFCKIYLKGRKNSLKLYAKQIGVKYNLGIIEFYNLNKEKIFEIEAKNIRYMSIISETKTYCKC